VFGELRRRGAHERRPVRKGEGGRDDLAAERTELGCCGRVSGGVNAHIGHGEQLQRAGDGGGGGVGGRGVEGESEHSESPIHTRLGSAARPARD